MSVPRSSVQEWLGAKEGKRWNPMPMNILVTDTNPQTNARNLDNTSVCLQIMQCAVVLSVLAHKWGCPVNRLWMHGDADCGLVRWLENDYKNVDWLGEYVICLLVEYANRYKRKHEGSKAVYEFFETYGNPVGLAPIGFLNATFDEQRGLDFRWRGPVTQAYRDFMCTRWDMARVKPTWGERTPPYWYIERLIKDDEETPPWHR